MKLSSWNNYNLLNCPAFFNERGAQKITESKINRFLCNKFLSSILYIQYVLSS